MVFHLGIAQILFFFLAQWERALFRPLAVQINKESVYLPLTLTTEKEEK